MNAALLLDACVVINLRGAGLWQELSAALDTRLVVVEQVAGEALRLLDDDGEAQPVDLQSMAADGQVEIWSLIDEELDRFVAFATRLGDGEAATLAAAASRGLPIATDDRLARRMACEHSPAISVLTTPQLVKAWASATCAPSARVAQIVQRVRARCCFTAPAHDPECDWWNQHLRERAA